MKDKNTFSYLSCPSLFESAPSWAVMERKLMSLFDNSRVAAALYSSVGGRTAFRLFALESYFDEVALFE